MWWVIIIVVVIIIILWGVAGGTFPSTGTNGTMPTNNSCEALIFWWQGLSPSQKALQLAWFTWKRRFCKA